MPINSILRSTEITKILLDQKLENGGTAVDATMGNGKDTLYLCQRVLPNGKVFAFDIQENALNNTLKLLKKEALGTYIGSQIHCICDSHEYFDHYISESVDVFMYNLGYLPGSDNSIITNPTTTIKSLDLALTMLKVGGIISIIVYYGHSGGMEEKKALEEYLGDISSEEYKIFQGTMPYNDHCPPIIYMIEKSRQKKQ
ncbi:tRNA (mnm(5)s(2)U34)-methyltransferase [Isachenkonia alkalipeptolytica]|uniref:SAM-dependent methyltransferase n=1 Tax=Isachenkonia alkalipeptolytica TaxID=2565777 RepID=A0AA43XL10_9CLOT|nr:class I SAM-dependent methyltransferase [Isachenkonia alkalipeptolytica]NBG88765.1 SAM-dependent methyltransferase [Isachenkonia alkalipeptolytica]